jgi:hypothetical protein
MYQPTLAGTGTPETRTDQRPRPSRPLPFTLRIAESPAPVAGAPALHSSAEAADFIRPQIGRADREAFVILHLDVKNQLLDVELHGLGDVDSSAVYARQVFRSALLRNASALGIKVLDHIIVGPKPGYFSFADKGLLDDYGLAASLGHVQEDPRDWDDDRIDYDDAPIDGVGFADPGGRSALRAATRRNPRNLPCPTCGKKNRLTPLDRARGYQCDECADRAEGFGD